VPIGRSPRGQSAATGIEVGRIRAGEVSALRDLRLASLRTDPLAFGRTYEREAALRDADWIALTADVAAGGGAGFIALVDAAPQGLCMALALRDAGDGASGLFAMSVAPVARGRRAGEALVAAAVAAARLAGAPALRLLVTQPTAARLYARCGFVDDGRRERLEHPPGVVEVGMPLDLAGS